MKADAVHVWKEKVPPEYHCRCEYCSVAIGELRQPSGEYYSRLERRKYYASEEEEGEGGHIAKTPLHISRWAVQQFTQPGDWVLDPTIGAGTTAVEALTQGRCAAGMELEYGSILNANIQKALDGTKGLEAAVRTGDARNIGDFLTKLDKQFALIVNNPPYFGDQSMPSPAKEGRGKEYYHLETKFFYDKELPNLAFLRENEEYWDTIRPIYGDCIRWLKPGGYFVTGIKDTMANKEPVLLHKMFCDVLRGLGLEFVGTAFLRHYPPTLHLSSYGKRYGVEPPKYQTISVFRKGA